MKISVVLILFLSLLTAQRSAIAEAAAGYASAQCMECHEEMAADHAASVHRGIQCLDCHPQAAVEDHEQLAPVDCRQCHAPHAEKVLHDAHSRVACKACHVKGGVPAVDPASRQVVFSGMFRPGPEWPPHRAIQSETGARCRDCHFQRNGVGASSWVLPAKSIVCMPCHVATFTVNDRTTLVSLFIFLMGTAGLATVWFSGSAEKGVHGFGKKIKDKIRFEPGAPFFEKFFRMLKVSFVEVVLVQRLFRVSPARWIIHALIFFPFLGRFAFGLAALLLSIFLPDGSVTIAMLDKNNAVRALFFDVTGLMIAGGAVAAVMRRETGQAEKIASLPEPGRGMTALIGLIVLVGFLLEAVRIAMTGWPPGSGWAFLGYGISLLLTGMTGLTQLHGYMWYAHAILSGAFIALIPFTRMSHILTAPIVLINDARRARVRDDFGNKNIT